MCHMRKDCILVLGNILSLYVKSLRQVIFASILVSPPLFSSMFLPWFYLGFYLAFHQKKSQNIWCGRWGKNKWFLGLWNFSYGSNLDREVTLKVTTWEGKTNSNKHLLSALWICRYSYITNNDSPNFASSWLLLFPLTHTHTHTHTSKAQRSLAKELVGCLSTHPMIFPA